MCKCLIYSRENFILSHCPNNCIDYSSAQLFVLIPQTRLITVEEPKGRNLYVPLTLIREKGTYGSVTVNFQVSHKNSVLSFFSFIFLTDFNKIDEDIYIAISHSKEMLFPGLAFIPCYCLFMMGMIHADRSLEAQTQPVRI